MCPREARWTQLDTEILIALQTGSQTSHQLAKLLAVPSRTMIWHLRRLLENGAVDAFQGQRTQLIYSLPGRHGNPTPGPKMFIRGKPRARKVER